MCGWYVAFCYSDETRQPRFRCEQIVEIGVQSRIGTAITDGQQLPARIQKETEFHCSKGRRSPLRQYFRSIVQRNGGPARLLKHIAGEAGFSFGVVRTAAM